MGKQGEMKEKCKNRVDYSSLSTFAYVWNVYNTHFQRTLALGDREVCLILILQDQRKYLTVNKKTSQFQKAERFKNKLIHGAQDQSQQMV